MKTLKLWLLVTISYAVMSGGTSGWAAEGIILKEVIDASSNYCHLKFPRIREETLSWERPVLKDPAEGDIVDFYGSCDYDPTGKAEAYRQQWDRYRERGYFGDE